MSNITFELGGEKRLENSRAALLQNKDNDPKLVNNLCDFVLKDEKASADRLRAYQLADDWKAERRDMLELCLEATRAGLLELKWDVICPGCGDGQSSVNLGTIGEHATCVVCGDFEVNFEKYVEVLFNVSPSVRKVSPKNPGPWGNPAQATTAAEVFSVQKFRDLFANEVLRADQPVSVGNTTIVFTDLKGSTKLYREVGDAPAFGLVADHFDILKKCIADEGGTIVKNIGDAIMAVFLRPVSALKAMIKAQEMTAMPGDDGRQLMLKVGIHYGRCLAVNLNDRIDYFGSTINQGARLEGQSSGNDIIITDAVHKDPEVLEFLSAAKDVSAETYDTTLKGFDQDNFKLWRVKKI